MLLKPYRDDFVYKSINNVDSVYNLTILPETDDEVIVVITAEENTSLLIKSCYERMATQIYYQRLQDLKVNKIIWIEKIIHKTSQETFFEVDLLWDKKSKFFHSPQWKPCDQKIIASIKTLCEEHVG